MSYPLVIGVSAFVGGIILVLRHLHVWRQKTDLTGDLNERKFLFSLFRRRTFCSVCISVLGFVISLFHFRAYWTERPTSWFILMCCALTLTIMIMAMAMFDMLAVSSIVRNEKSKTSSAAKELAREYHRLKEKARKSAGETPENPGD